MAFSVNETSRSYIDAESLIRFQIVQSVKFRVAASNAGRAGHAEKWKSHRNSSDRSNERDARSIPVEFRHASGGQIGT